MVVIDTDVLIWILRGKLSIKDKFEYFFELSGGQMFLTPIQFAEIYEGLREKEKIISGIFLQSFKNVDINYQHGRFAGEFLQKYKKSHSVTMADALTAAIVKIGRFQLWTLNKKHYPMLEEDEIALL